MFSTRENFIAYSVARYVTHLANASPSDYQNAITIAMTLANKLEMAGVAPWPQASWKVQPVVAAPQSALQVAAPPIVQGQSDAAADNTARLLAAIGQPPPAGGPVTTGTVVGENGGPKVGTVQNPAPSGSVIAAHGEVQGHQEKVIGPVISTPGIVSDVQAVRQPGTVPLP